jgi:hypothetical protein
MGKTEGGKMNLLSDPVIAFIERYLRVPELSHPLILDGVTKESALA